MRDPAQLPERQNQYLSSFFVDISKRPSDQKISWAIGFLAILSDEERRTVFESFCVGCGGADPNCQTCWRREHGELG